MNRIYSGAEVGRKNILFGVALFLILGVVVGIPLTINMFGGSVLTSDQYQAWKVVHAYGVFLAFINYFFGLCIDRLNLAKGQKEISSWSFLAAGFIGGFGRMVLLLLSSPKNSFLVVSLVETALFILGTIIFVRGQTNK